MDPAREGDLDPQDAFELLFDATQRLVRTVDGFVDGDLERPSLLPDWSRAHVIAHLALNAEALAGVLEGRTLPVPATMYRSDQARDSDIADLARAKHAELRKRFLAATTLLADAVDRFPDQHWPDSFERTPGGRTIRYAAIPGMRLREVEIHHVDLDARFDPRGWSDAFSAHLVSAMV